jgi:tripartite-type tricarboxylate transporter receptor subunit TctC
MRTLLLAALTFALGTVMTPAAAQSPAAFYKGKTITILLGHPPGGSYDLYARLAADHMKRFIPGNPNIIVQHRPGGGGVAAVLTFYAQGARDGTMMGLFTETSGVHCGCGQALR